MSTGVAVAIFACATAAVIVVAPRMAKVSDQITARTRIGAALFGAVFLGASTSLPGIVVTVTAALAGNLALAAGNALGGIVAQTMFLALADVTYGKGALQRKAVSRKATAQLALVVGLLALVVVALGAPQATIGVHVTTPLLVIGYLTGIMLIRRMPSTRQSDEPVEEASTTDVPAETTAAGTAHDRGPLGSLWLRYAIFVAVLMASGWALVESVDPIASAIGLDAAAAGALLTSLVTSSPELLTAIAAARRGSLQLAVGDIAGGNAFDVLFLAAADVVVLGTLYRELEAVHILLAGVAVLLNAVLVVGFVRRGAGIAGRVAPESIVVLAGYAAVAVAMVLR